MTEKDIKKLSRADLLQMLIDQSEELASVKERLAAAEKKLQDRTLVMDRAGSLAEAALQLNGVFEAAEASCQQYMENLRAVTARQEAVCEKREAEFILAITRQEEETQRVCDALRAETEAQCRDMVARAEAESNAYWEDVSARIDTYLSERKGLRELLAAMQAKKRNSDL